MIPGIASQALLKGASGGGGGGGGGGTARQVMGAIGSALGPIYLNSGSTARQAQLPIVSVNEGT